MSRRKALLFFVTGPLLTAHFDYLVRYTTPMDPAVVLGKYIRHLRKQPAHMQRVHAFSISGIITVLITVAWLHFHYGFWGGETNSLYDDGLVYEEKVVVEEAQLPGPGETFTSFADEAKSRFYEILEKIQGHDSSENTVENK